MQNTVSKTPCLARAGVLGMGLLLVVQLCTPVAAAPRRIHIPGGHGTIRVHGFLRGSHDVARFVLYARRGRTLSLLMVRGGASVVMLTFPSGREDGAPGGISDLLPQTGDYHIRVSEHHMGEPWRGPFTLKVSLH